MSYQMLTYPIIQLLATRIRDTVLQKTRIEYWLVQKETYVQTLVFPSLGEQDSFG